MMTNVRFNHDAKDQNSMNNHVQEKQRSATDT